MNSTCAASAQLFPWAARLGYAGAEPFVALAAAAWWMPDAGRAPVAQALLAYGAAIASFMGAIHWGLTVRVVPTPRPGPLLWGGAA